MPKELTMQEAASLISDWREQGILLEVIDWQAAVDAANVPAPEPECDRMGCYNTPYVTCPGCGAQYCEKHPPIEDGDPLTCDACQWDLTKETGGAVLDRIFADIQERAALEEKKQLEAKLYAEAEAQREQEEWDAAVAASKEANARLMRERAEERGWTEDDIINFQKQVEESRLNNEKLLAAPAPSGMSDEEHAAFLSEIEQSQKVNEELAMSLLPPEPELPVDMVMPGDGVVQMTDEEYDRMIAAQQEGPGHA